jgi:hypothetical protein
MCNKFLGKNGDCTGKAGSDHRGDDVADERDEVGCGLRVVSHKFGGIGCPFVLPFLAQTVPKNITMARSA